MTTKRKTKKRVEWSYDSEKWVRCVDCGYEYFIESHELEPCCHLCGSKEFEESIREKDYLDLDELDDLL